jgi:antirestriction protein ArdC
MNNQANTPNSQPTTTTFPFTPEPLGPVPAPSPHQVGGIPVPPLSAAGGSKARGQKGGTVFDVVTDRIISLMEQGTAPWRASWVSTAGKPISLSTGKPYRGINHFLLSMIAQLTGYTSPYWLTFNQVSERGGKVRKGEKGSPCFFWKVYQGAPGKGCEDGDSGTTEGNKRFVARYYTVFNVEQCEGLEYPKPVLPDPEKSGATPIEKAESIVNGYKGPTLETKGSQPCYAPMRDTVVMPARELFFSPEGYYATLFHEMTHSTGHKSRLDRKVEAPAPFGSKDYSREELVAELGASFLCSEAGIAPPVIENQAAYLAGWLKVLKADKRAIVVAAAQAEKAADYILGHKEVPVTGE